MEQGNAIEEFPEPEFLEGAPPTPSECMVALLAHAGGFLFSFVAPAIVMMTRQDKSAFVVRHAREAVNFQVSLFLHSLFIFVPSIIAYALASSNGAKWPIALLAACAVGLLISVPMVIAEIWIIVRACRAALQGRDYRYPLTIRLI